MTTAQVTLLQVLLLRKVPYVRFRGMTHAEINQAVGAHQRGLLKQWMGTGSAGPRKAMGSPLPEGLTPETLRAFAEIARGQIDAGRDTIGTQAARLELIERVLERLRP